MFIIALFIVSNHTGLKFLECSPGIYTFDNGNFSDILQVDLQNQMSPRSVSQPGRPDLQDLAAPASLTSSLTTSAQPVKLHQHPALP